MIKKSAKYLAGAIAAAGLFFYVKYYALTFPVVIVYTNDAHGNLLPRKGQGGVAALGAFIKRQSPDTILLDAGDFFQGTPESDLSKGGNMVLAMNMLGYDAATMGNHEFDFGQKNLAALEKTAEFPFLSANIYLAQIVGTTPAKTSRSRGHSGKRPHYLKPYIIKEARGAKIAIFGLTSDRTPAMSMPANVRGLVFADPVEDGRRLVEELSGKADVIIALTHLGYEKDGETWNGDRRLAAEVKGIDAIIGGHTHTRLPGKNIGGTLIVQTGGGGRTAGKMTLRLCRRTKKPRLITNRIVNISAEKHGEDPAIKKFVDAIAAETTKKLSKAVATARTDILRGPRNAESPMGNLLTDIMRRKSGAQIAFHNSGGIRADFKKGEITLRDVYNVNPFDNTIVTMKMTGADVRELLKKSFGGAYGILQISGLRVFYDKKSEDLLVETPAGNGYAPFDDKKIYVVATNSFLAAGGDGFGIFAAARDKRDTGVNFRDAVTEYLAAAGTLSEAAGRPDGRIAIK